MDSSLFEREGVSPGAGLKEYVLCLPDALSTHGFPLVRRVVALNAQDAFLRYLQSEIKGVRNSSLGIEGCVYEVPSLKGDLVDELDESERLELLVYQFAHDVLGKGRDDEHLVEVADRMLGAPYVRDSPRFPSGNADGDSFFSSRLRSRDAALIARGINPYDEWEARDAGVDYRGSFADSD